MNRIKKIDKYKYIEYKINRYKYEKNRLFEEKNLAFTLIKKKTGKNNGSNRESLSDR